MTSRVVATGIVLITSASHGCTAPTPRTDYRTLIPILTQDVEAAREANGEGLTFVETGDYESAERAFRRACQADISYAAAHNNLGLALLTQGRIHEAAVELTYATRLAPDAVEPVINLGKVFERVGWLEAAEKQYQRALETDPGNMHAAYPLAYIWTRTRGEPEKIDRLLRLVAQSAEETDWRNWAEVLAEAYGGSGSEEAGD